MMACVLLFDIVFVRIKKEAFLIEMSFVESWNTSDEDTFYYDIKKFFIFI